MKKAATYLDDKIDDAIEMLYKKSAENPEQSAECRYRIVVLLILSSLHFSLGRIRTGFFLCLGLSAGLLLRCLL